MKQSEIRVSTGIQHQAQLNVFRSVRKMLAFVWCLSFKDLTLKGHQQPEVFVGVQAISAIFCNTENGADSLHADIATAPTTYRTAIAVERSFFTIGIGTIRRDI